MWEVIMFDMTSQQQTAFKEATNGVTSVTYSHTILFLVGAVTTIWLFLIFLGSLKNPNRSVYDSMYEFAFGIAIYISVGIIVYFT